MRDLALHILDIARNSIEAGATVVEVTVVEDSGADRLTLTVSDNGRGMDEATASQAADPFYTTRSTRRFGLGLALLSATCERCGGGLRITSRPGQGTVVEGCLGLSHLDRPPLGDMGGTIQALACDARSVTLRYRHAVDGRWFDVDTAAMQSELGDVCLCEPSVLRWLAGHVNEGIHDLGSAA